MFRLDPNALVYHVGPFKVRVMDVFLWRSRIWGWFHPLSVRYQRGYTDGFCAGVDTERARIERKLNEVAELIAKENRDRAAAEG